MKPDSIEYRNEEEVKIQAVLPWLEALGYKRECMEFEKQISVQEGRKKKSVFADIVIYTGKSKETPLVVVDAKSPHVVLSKTDRDQVVSYARLLPQLAPLAVLTNGQIVQVYQTLDKTRIKELPPRKDIVKDFVQTVLSANIQKALREEATRELFAIDDVATFKDLLKKCHTTIRNNEGFDSIKAFDELSKVLFAKMYEEQYHKDANRFTKKNFEALEKQNVNIVQQLFREIQGLEAYKEIFAPDTKIDLQDRTTKTIVEVFEDYDLTLTRFDVKGEAFEYFLSDTFTGGLGEYFTPRNIVEFMVEAVSPKIGEKIIDPFCGTGGFLIYAFDLVSEKIRLQDFADDEKRKWQHQLSSASLYGTDWKDRTAQACKMNMIVHGDGNTGIHQHNGLLDVPHVVMEDMFDLCFTNPPFGAVETNDKILNAFDLGRGRSAQKREVLAIERCLRLVKPGKGIVAIILPDGILNNDSFAYVREFIHQKAQLLAVIGLNKETFEGYNAGAKTSILFLKRKAADAEFSAQPVFMAVCTNSGYAPTGEQIPGNQLPDILFDYQNYAKHNFEAIFPYTKAVKLDSASARLDAERYIDFMEVEKLESPEVLAQELYRNLVSFGRLNESVKDALSQKLFSQQHNEEAFGYTALEELLEGCANKILLEADTEYKQLGVRGKGEGIFVRKVGLGKKVKATALNQVQAGWLVYSRLFAKNGSFAIVEKEHEQGVFSDEFPTFKAKPTAYGEQDLLEYLVFYLVSSQATNYIIRLTTGSTKASRGRLKEEQFLKLKIPLPKDLEVFKKIVTPIKQARAFQKDVKLLAENMNLLTRAFQISLPDIRE